MNLMKATVSQNADGLFLDTGTFKYKVSQTVAEAIKKVGVTDVTLGVRPEDLIISTKAGSDSIFECEIYVVEPLGANTVVDIKLKDGLYKAVASGTFRADVGQKVWVSFLPESTHVFNTTTGQAIT